MINIDDFKTFFYTVANKNGRGTVTPSQFNSIVSQGLMAYYNKKMEAINGITPFSKVEYNQRGIEDLSEIKEERNVLLNLGDILIPDGTTYDLDGNQIPEMWHFGSLSYNYYSSNSNIPTDRPIEIVKDNEWSKRTSSTIVSPTMKRPIAKILSDRIKVRPRSITNVVLTYYRFPYTPKWGYIIANNRPVYDSSISVDIDASKDAFNEIAMICLGLLGINLREQDLVQYAANNEMKGI